MAHKVLIVDDDPALREWLGRLLAYEGYTTVAASDVPTAMRNLREEKPDLLITDIRLEPDNGLHIIAMAPDRIPAIVLTGYDDPVLQRDARRFGAEYMVKPVDPSVLLDTVARQLSGAQPRPAFRTVRRWPRITVAAPVEVRLQNFPARLVDISDGGARLAIQGVADPEVPSVANLVVERARTNLLVHVAWARRQDDSTWLCGVSVPTNAQSQWAWMVKAVTWGRSQRSLLPAQQSNC
jgi:DNA-binding response OmpR family regulator